MAGGDGRGAWIPGKARGLVAECFGAGWEEVSPDVMQGHCPGASCHSTPSAATDCRLFLGYGDRGESPGAYCLHNSCKGVLDDLNKVFRERIFARSEGEGSGSRGGAGDGWEKGVARLPRREEWIPEFDMKVLRSCVRSVPEGIDERWFMARSAVDPRGVSAGEFIEHVFKPGEFVMVFTEFKGPGDFLWAVGKRGYRLGKERGVRPVPSDLPGGGADGVWYLSNPVDGLWHPNPRQQGKYSRRSAESVTAWRHLVLECDEEKTLKRKAGALRDAQAKGFRGAEAVKFLTEETGRKKWAEEMARAPESWEHWMKVYPEWAKEVPQLWFRFLAMQTLPVVAIYSSGGASWHALVRVEMPDKPSFDAMLRNDAKRVLPIFGADAGAMTPVRLTRLPGTMRGSRRQRLIYLNPEAPEKRILEMGERRVVG